MVTPPITNHSPGRRRPVLRICLTGLSLFVVAFAFIAWLLGYEAVPGIGRRIAYFATLAACVIPVLSGMRSSGGRWRHIVAQVGTPAVLSAFWLFIPPFPLEVLVDYQIALHPNYRVSKPDEFFSLTASAFDMFPSQRDRIKRLMLREFDRAWESYCRVNDLNSAEESLRRMYTLAALPAVQKTFGNDTTQIDRFSREMKFWEKFRDLQTDCRKSLEQDDVSIIRDCKAQFAELAFEVGQSSNQAGLSRACNLAQDQIAFYIRLDDMANNAQESEK